MSTRGSATGASKNSTTDVLPSLLTANEVVDLLRVSRRTLTRLVSEGKLPSIKVGGRRMFRHDDIAVLTTSQIGK